MSTVIKAGSFCPIHKGTVLADCRHAAREFHGMCGDRASDISKIPEFDFHRSLSHRMASNYYEAVEGLTLLDTVQAVDETDAQIETAQNIMSQPREVVMKCGHPAPEAADDGGCCACNRGELKRSAPPEIVTVDEARDIFGDEYTDLIMRDFANGLKIVRGEK